MVSYKFKMSLEFYIPQFQKQFGCNSLTYPYFSCTFPGTYDGNQDQTNLGKKGIFIKIQEEQDTCITLSAPGFPSTHEGGSLSCPSIVEKSQEKALTHLA